MTQTPSRHPPVPHLLPHGDTRGLLELESAGDGLFRVGNEGVCRILAPADRKVEFVGYKEHTLAYVRSALGYPAIYPLHPTEMERPVRAVLMDLDGTSVHSEAFWIWLIELSIASTMGDPSFRLCEADLPYVSGHSVSEHLQYCITTYCPDCSLDVAWDHYFTHSRRELQAVLDGKGNMEAMRPAPGLRTFLLALKRAGIRIALVTSGLYEKAWPEIVAAFRQIDLGDPRAFYDAIITAGFPIRKGEPGTLGELSPKPHPWLYAEAARVGLRIPFEQRQHVVGLDDSGAGVCSVRLAGFPTIGIGGGNIEHSGTRGLCHAYCENLLDVLDVIS